MYKRVAVAGVRQVGDAETLPIQRMLDLLGKNSGNMMFTESIHRAIENPKIITYSLTESELFDCDAIVIAAANWLAEGNNLSWLANRLESTSLPVFLVGLGAQSGINGRIPRLGEDTLRALRIVSERSATIAARGDFTCSVLEHYGIHNFVSVGCPSMLLNGKQGPKFSVEPSNAAVVFHGTRHGFHKAGELQNFFYSEALKSGSDILLQSETSDIYFVFNRGSDEEITDAARNALKASYGTGDISNIESFLRDQGRFFSNYRNWIDYMKTKTFCVGTRIHGTVASIVAGTPAVLVAHDSRTLELAKAMGIPFIEAKDFKCSSDDFFEQSRDAFEAARGFSNYSTYYDQYLEFFRTNGLQLSSQFLET